MIRTKSATRLLAFIIAILMVISPFVQTLAQSPGTSPGANAVPYSDYGLSALSSNDRITLSQLKSWTGGNLTIAAFENYIQRNLTPYDIREVLLDIGWENYTVGTIPMEQWVNDWLTACDIMGVEDVIYMGQLTSQGVGSPWIRSVIAKDPSTQTFSSNGSAVSFISYDSPDVAIFLEQDLAKIYSYYGAHLSWVGIGTGSSANDPYYQSGQLFPGLGYSNLTISNFVNSHYYYADVNASGVLPNGQTDPLWTSYKNVQPSILLSSGQLGTSSPVYVYGNGTDSNYVEMRFELDENVTGLTISWYGNEVGSPEPLIVDLYGDANGSLNLAKHITSFNFNPSSFNTTLAWQTGPEVPVNMTSGYYWAKLSSPMSSQSSYYTIYTKDQVTKFLALAAESYVGPGFQHASTILWLRNQAGANVALYPYQQAQLDNSYTQKFIANSTFSFNTVFLYLSDRIYDPVNATITVRDLTANGSVGLATGLLSQQLGHGIEGWVPISLNSAVTTVPGHSYAITLAEPNGGYSWGVVLRGVITDPSFAGFQGQASSWLFQLGDLSVVQGHLDYHDMTTNGADGVTAGYLDAVRIMPSSNESLKSVAILMASNTQSGNYSKGYFSVSIWNSNSTGLTPSSPLSKEVNVPATEVPSNGIFNITGLNQPLTGGRYYWIVFSTNSSITFTLGRFTNAYAFDVQVSLNGGTSWQEPREGPTDFGFVVTLSNQDVGTFISGKPEIQVDAMGYFAEPFYANETEQVTGVYFGQPPDCTPTVSINRDTAAGHPSLSPIASGVYNGSSLAGGAQFVQFSSVANLQSGQEYWLVIHPTSGSCDLYPLVYLPSDPNMPSNATSIVSQDGGTTWSRISNSTSSLVYQLTSQVTKLPVFNTSQLAAYLSEYHSPNLSEGVIHGWTGYIAASEFSLFGQITSWLNDFSGKGFDFYGQGETNVLNQLPVKGVVVLPSNSSSNSCSTLQSQLTSTLPLDGVQYLNVANSSVIAACARTGLAPILEQLSYILGTGQLYGQASSTKVLVVGDAVTDNLTRYLSIAYDTAYAQLGLDPTLKQQGNLSQYSAIVWTSTNNPAAKLEYQIAKYVKQGGVFIVATSGGNKSVLQSVQSSLPVSNATQSPLGEAYLNALVAHTSYANLSVNSSSSETTGSSANLSITIHSYGRGKYYLAWFSATEINQVSDPVVLLSNIVATSEGLPEPFWYDNVGSAQSPVNIEFSVIKTGSGQILVWLTNTGSRTSEVNLSLNGTYYGLPSDWKEFDLNTMEVSTGLGSSVTVEGNVTAGSWLPIVVLPYSSAARIDYSNVQIDGQFVYPAQSYYELYGVNGQDVLLLLSSNTTAAQVLVNNNQSLRGLYSLGNFSLASSGWVYYGDSNTLFVKFTATGSSTLRYIAYSGVAKGSAELPSKTILIVFVALIIVEIESLLLLALFGTRHRGVR